MNKISVVIRNKNEAANLENVLSILTKVYFEDYEEIVVVDNYSTDDSLIIAKKYGCKIVMIKDFSYGRATNLGIETSIYDYVLLLSSHAIPVGNSFFKNSIEVLNSGNNIAGIRYINSIENYNRALKNNFMVKEPLKFGLMTGCAIVNKKVWTQFKFDEELSFSEDKEWSETVFNNGYEILDFNETFFYFIKRDRKSNISRFKNETLAYHIMHKKNFPSEIKIFASFVKKILFSNTKEYVKVIHNDILILKAKIEINRKLKNRF